MVKASQLIITKGCPLLRLAHADRGPEQNREGGKIEEGEGKRDDSADAPILAASWMPVLEGETQ